MVERKIYCNVLEGTVYENRCLFKLSKVIENNKSCESCILRELEQIKSCGTREETPERRKKKKVRARGSHQAEKNIFSTGLSKIPEGEVEAIEDSPQITKQSYSVRNLISLLGKPERTIRKWAEKGKIPAHKVGREWRFPKEEIDRWLSEREDGTHRIPDPEEGEGPVVPLEIKSEG